MTTPQLGNMNDSLYTSPSPIAEHLESSKFDSVVGSHSVIFLPSCTYIGFSDTFFNRIYDRHERYSPFVCERKRLNQPGR
jgi:hypothetical protein